MVLLGVPAVAHLDVVERVDERRHLVRVSARARARARVSRVRVSGCSSWRTTCSAAAHTSASPCTEASLTAATQAALLASAARRE